MDVAVRETRIQRLLNKVRQTNKWLLAAILTGLLTVSAMVIAYAWSELGSSDSALVLYEVKRGDLPIVVTERGYLESQEQTVIECEVSNYDRYSGNSRLTILSIVPNGSVVQKGDLLVELDDSGLRDRLESELLEFESDKSTLMQAEARESNQLTQNETALAEAQLAVKLAELDKQMYIDEERGTFKLAVEEIERQIDDTRNSILEAQAALKLQETEKEGIEELFRLGYKGKSDLDQSRFAFMKAEAALAAAVNRLSNLEASREQLETYEREKEILRLQGEVDTAKRNLKQVKVTNESELAQVKAQVFEARERVERQRSRNKRMQTLIDNCTIHAPHAGMVVYAQGEGGGVIAEGVGVRERQEILRLPDLEKMQIRTQIHEAVLEQVKVGQEVNIRVDAFPNRTYRGVVSEVAVVPAQNTNTNAKTYDCIIKIPQKVSRLKPGMTAVSEIRVDRLKDVHSVPVQAVLQVENETWCYVESAYGVEKRPVELGRNNDRFVQITSGVQAGDRVVLNPMTIYDQEQQESKPLSPEDGVPDTLDGPGGDSTEVTGLDDDPTRQSTAVSVPPDSLEP